MASNNKIGIRLTDRDIEWLQRLANGDSPKELGGSSVKTRLMKIRVRLGAKTTAHAIAIALRQGAIE